MPQFVPVPMRSSFDNSVEMATAPQLMMDRDGFEARAQGRASADANGEDAPHGGPWLRRLLALPRRALPTTVPSSGHMHLNQVLWYFGLVPSFVLVSARGVVLSVLRLGVRPGATANRYEVV